MASITDSTHSISTSSSNLPPPGSPNPPNLLVGVATQALESHQSTAALSSDLASRTIIPLNESSNASMPMMVSMSSSSPSTSFPICSNIPLMKNQRVGKKQIDLLSLEDLQHRFQTRNSTDIRALWRAQTALIQQLNRSNGDPVDLFTVVEFATALSKMIENNEQNVINYIDTLGNKKYKHGNHRGQQIKNVMVDYSNFKEELLTHLRHLRGSLAATTESSRSSIPTSIEPTALSLLQGSSSNSSSSALTAPSTNLLSGLSILASLAGTSSSNSSSTDPDRTESDDETPTLLPSLSSAAASFPDDPDRTESEDEAPTLPPSLSNAAASFPDDPDRTESEDEAPTLPPSLSNAAASFPSANTSNKRGNWQTRLTEFPQYKIADAHFESATPQLKLAFTRAQYTLLGHLSKNPVNVDFIGKADAFVQTFLKLANGHNEKTVHEFFSDYGSYTPKRGKNARKALSKTIPNYKPFVAEILTAKKQNKNNIPISTLRSLFGLPLPSALIPSASAALSSSSSSSSSASGTTDPHPLSARSAPSRRKQPIRDWHATLQRYPQGMLVKECFPDAPEKRHHDFLSSQYQMLRHISQNSSLLTDAFIARIQSFSRNFLKLACAVDEITATRFLERYGKITPQKGHLKNKSIRELITNYESFVGAILNAKREQQIEVPSEELEYLFGLSLNSVAAPPAAAMQVELPDPAASSSSSSSSSQDAMSVGKKRKGDSVDTTEQPAAKRAKPNDS